MKSKNPISMPPGKPEFFSTAVERERTFFYEKISRIDGVAIVCGGREHCLDNYQIDRKHFPYFCIEWVASGRGELNLAGKTWSLFPGSFFIYGPGVPHRITTSPDEKLVKYFVDFEGPGAIRLLSKNRLKIPFFCSIPPGTGILEIFDRLIEAGTSAMLSGPRLCHLLLKCLMVLASEKYPDPELQQGRAFQTYMRCRHHIEQNLRSLSRMEEVAGACHLDPAYLARVFREFSGESPHRFLTRLKMNAAALQLVRRNAMVKEIAEEFGFADPYHFSRTFKKIHGLSPKAYSRQSQFLSPNQASWEIIHKFSRLK